MIDGGERIEAEHASLALYLLGALDEDERAVFERHLAGCDRCLDEATEFGATTSALGLLPAGDPGDLLAAVRPPARAASAAGPRALLRPPPRRTGRDSGRRPEFSRRRMVTVALTAVAVVAAGSTTVLVLHDGSATQDHRAGLVLMASAQAPGGGVSLSVLVMGTEYGSTVRLTMTGLRPGLLYRLYAVSRDGRTHQVRDWLGAAGTQQITGELSLPVDTLAFFTVTEANGDPVVTAPLVRSTGQR